MALSLPLPLLTRERYFIHTLEASDFLPLAVWGLWGPWSECSRRKYCQEGQQHRRRVCISLDDSAYCVGVSMEARDCPAAACVHASSENKYFRYLVIS